MWAAVSKRTLTALLDDESGDGFADYSVVLGLLAVQCICGAIALSHRFDDAVRTVQAVFS